MVNRNCLYVSSCLKRHQKGINCWYFTSRNRRSLAVILEIRLQNGLKNMELISDMASVITAICLNVVKYSLLVWLYIVRFWLMIRYTGQKRVVSPITNELLLLSATKMAELIREGKVKSSTLVSSYIDRIQEENSNINAIAEDRFEQALAESRKVDSLIAYGSKTAERIAEDTPLLGVPITVKLMIEVEGMHSTSGSKYFANRLAVEDADVIKILKKAGVIIIATTNVPEFGINLDSSNKLYGSSKNPYDSTKAAGGSSGGEAASISSAFSVLGIGSDLGGSLRIPATFCGIFAHKPTSGIISVRGHFPAVPDSMATLGPMCRYAEDLLTSMKVLVGQNRKTMKLDDPVDLTNIKVYYMESISDIFSQPMDSDILKRLGEAVAGLQKRFNAKPEKLQMESMKHSFPISVSKVFENIGRPKEYLLGKGNDVSNVVEVLKSLIGKSEFTSYFLTMLCFDGMFGGILDILISGDKLEKPLKAIREKFDSILDENSILLMPTYPSKSLYRGESLLTVFSACYTAIFNVLGLPVTQCPLGLDGVGEFPIGIQIVAAKGNDRLTMKCAVELEKIFGGWRPPRH